MAFFAFSIPSMVLIGRRHLSGELRRCYRLLSVSACACACACGLFIFSILSAFLLRARFVWRAFEFTYRNTYLTFNGWGAYVDITLVLFSRLVLADGCDWVYVDISLHILVFLWVKMGGVFFFFFFFFLASWVLGWVGESRLVLSA